MYKYYSLMVQASSVGQIGLINGSQMLSDWVAYSVEDQWCSGKFEL